MCSNFTRLLKPSLAHAWQREDKQQSQGRAAIQLLFHLKPNLAPKSLMLGTARGVLLHIAHKPHVAMRCSGAELEAKGRLRNLLPILHD